MIGYEYEYIYDIPKRTVETINIVLNHTSYTTTQFSMLALSLVY